MGKYLFHRAHGVYDSSHLPGKPHYAKQDLSANEFNILRLHAINRRAKTLQLDLISKVLQTRSNESSGNYKDLFQTPEEDFSVSETR